MATPQEDSAKTGKVSLQALDDAVFSLHGANRSIKQAMGRLDDDREYTGDTLVSYEEAEAALEKMSPINRLNDHQLREAFREAPVYDRGGGPPPCPTHTGWSRRGARKRFGT